MVNTRQINKNGLSFECPDYYDIGKYPSSDKAHKSIVALSKNNRECELYVMVYRRKEFDNNAKRNISLLERYLQLQNYKNITINKKLPYCFNANVNHQMGNIKTTIVFNFDHDDVIMIVGNLIPASNYDCIEDIKIILDTLHQNNIIESAKRKITSRNKTILGFISIIWTLLFIPFINMNLYLSLYSLYIPTVFPAIFLIMPSEKIKNSKILSIISILIVSPLLIINLHTSFDMIVTLFNPTSYATFLDDIPYVIWRTLYCLFNLFCAILLFIPTRSEGKNDSQNICKKCGNPLNQDSVYCDNCGKKINHNHIKSFNHKKLNGNDENQRHKRKQKKTLKELLFYSEDSDNSPRISKTKIISLMVFLIILCVNIINNANEISLSLIIVAIVKSVTFALIIYGAGHILKSFIEKND